MGNIPALLRLSGLEFAKDQATKGLTSTANVIILGVSPAEDRNSYKKWQNREAYKSDPKAALTQGKVKLVTGKNGTEYPVALDNEPMISRTDKDGNKITETNPNYGEPIPDAMKINVPLILANLDNQPKEEFLMGSMSWDNELKNLPDIGKQSTVYGKQNKEYFTISKDAYEGDEVYQKAYDVALRVMQKNDLWYDLTTIDDAPITEEVDGKRKNVYTKFVTKGTVQKVQIIEATDYNNNPYQKVSLTIGDSDVPNGIKLSTRYEPMVAYISERVTRGDDVIVTGCKKSFQKKDKGVVVNDEAGNPILIPYYELWGAIKSFNNDEEERLRAKGLIK